MKTLTQACLAIALMGLGSAAGCASTQVAPSEISAPKEKMAAAVEVGADDNAQASLHLKLANDQYTRATKQLKEGDDAQARRTLDRASVDAELALELARLENTRTQATEAAKSIDALRKEHGMTTDDND